MKPRLKAVLVHGMGSNPAWWDFIAAALERIGVTTVAPAMPSLETAGPEAWCRAVASQLEDGPTILIGHSLGAAVCMEVARERLPAGLILLACPPFFPDFSPDPPPETGLSVSATVRVGRFLLAACAKPAPMTVEAIHFAGATDPWVPERHARRLPFPLEIIPGLGHGVNRSPRFALRIVRHVLNSTAGHQRLDPGSRLEYCARHAASPAASLGLDETAPPPARLHVEVTTRCQLRCRACARTLRRAAEPDADMPEELFKKLLEESPCARDVFLVGLGEPLLHPQLARLVALAADEGRQVHLVTNGLRASREVLAELQVAGLAEVTFSLDATDERLFRELRGGASLELVLNHFRAVPAGLRKSVFVTLSVDNAAALSGIVDLAAQEGLPAIGVTDLNFPENRARSLAGNESVQAALEQAIAHAHRRGVVLVGPHFHDTPDVVQGWRRAQVKSPVDLTRRAVAHSHCLAPWRIVVVGAEGGLVACDCAPQTRLGDLSRTELGEAWNGAPMRAWRRQVLAGSGKACRVCPRY